MQGLLLQRDPSQRQIRYDLSGDLRFYGSLHLGIDRKYYREDPGVVTLKPLKRRTKNGLAFAFARSHGSMAICSPR